MQQPETPGGGLRLFSTRQHSVGRRFEYWRSLHQLIELDTPTRDGARNFNAELMQYIASNGAVFGVTRSDDTIARFARSEGEFVLLSIPVSGKVDMAYGKDKQYSLRAADTTGVVLVDGLSHLTTSVSDHYSHIYLTIDRNAALLALQGDEDRLARGVSLLAQGGLTEMLRSHLQEMAIRRRSLTAHEADVAVKVAGDLALGALAQGVVGHDSERGISNSALYEAACRFIRINIARMDLTAETIARGIGCSRSHLYRVFELQDETVGMAIRRYRFENAVSLLENASYPSIKQIAYESGYKSAAAFSRFFRDYTGLSPSDFQKSR